MLEELFYVMRSLRKSTNFNSVEQLVWSSKRLVVGNSDDCQDTRKLTSDFVVIERRQLLHQLNMHCKASNSYTILAAEFFFFPTNY